MLKNYKEKTRNKYKIIKNKLSVTKIQSSWWKISCFWMKVHNMYLNMIYTLTTMVLFASEKKLLHQRKVLHITLGVSLRKVKTTCTKNNCIYS